MKALSQDEILKVLKAVSDNPRDLAMILLAFRHGMRASEVCGLELKDVDLKNGEITIRRLKGSLKTTQPLADLQGRPLLSEKRVLRSWLAERGNHPSKYVFTSQKSGRRRAGRTTKGQTAPTLPQALAWRYACRNERQPRGHQTSSRPQEHRFYGYLHRADR